MIEATPARTRVSISYRANGSGSSSLEYGGSAPSPPEPPLTGGPALTILNSSTLALRIRMPSRFFSAFSFSRRSLVVMGGAARLREWLDWEGVEKGLWERREERGDMRVLWRDVPAKRDVSISR